MNGISLNLSAVVYPDTHTKSNTYFLYILYHINSIHFYFQRGKNILQILFLENNIQQRNKRNNWADFNIKIIFFKFSFQTRLVTNQTERKHLAYI